MKIQTALIIASVSLAVLTRSNAQEPKHFKLVEFEKKIKRLPKYIGFGYGCAACFQKRIYVSCNVGLVVIPEGGEVELLQWNSNDGVIEGPWLDRANGGLWAQQATDGSFVRFDGKKWDSVAMPVPPNGTFTRGDVLSGFRCISGKQSFYLEGGNGVWQWNQKNSSWKLEPIPPMPEGSAIRAFLPYQNERIYFVRLGYELGFVDNEADNKAAVYRSPGKWQHQSTRYLDVKEYVVTNDGACVRSSSGKIYDFSSEKPVQVECPERCEAIARTSAGELLASFPNKGVFLRSGGAWKLKARPPYAAGEGEHWAHLAEDGGRIVLTTAPVPHLVSVGRAQKFVHTGTAGIWISNTGDFQPVRIGK